MFLEILALKVKSASLTSLYHRHHLRRPVGGPYTTSAAFTYTEELSECTENNSNNNKGQNTLARHYFIKTSSSANPRTRPCLLYFVWSNPWEQYKDFCLFFVFFFNSQSCHIKCTYESSNSTIHGSALWNTENMRNKILGLRDSKEKEDRIEFHLKEIYTVNKNLNMGH